MALAFLTTLLATAISVVPASECPSSAAIASELERLGALAALEQVGAAEIAVEQAWLRIEIRDQRGIVLGGRRVSAPADCAARASLAAVLIAAWTGEWIATNLGEPPGAAQPAAGASVEPRSVRARPNVPDGPPSEPVPASAVPPAAPPIARAVVPAAPPPSAPPPPAPPPPAPPPPVVTAAASPGPIVHAPNAATPVGRPLQVEVGLLGFGAHDGDAGVLGLGGQAALLGERLSLIALVEETGQRQRTLGPGQASYGSVRFGLSAAVRRAWTHLFVDLALLPELQRTVVQGLGLVQAKGVIAWSVVADGRARLGWKAGRVAPFLYLGAGWSFRREHLTLDDRPDAAITLSRLDLAAGLGIAVFVR